MTEPHDSLWHEWYATWHDADASKPKPSYEEWLEKRLEADMQRARAELATEKRLHELTVSGYRTRLEAAEMKYNELLFAVGNKHEGESRHETALRYIRETESRCSRPLTALAGEKKP